MESKEAGQGIQLWASLKGQLTNTDYGSSLRSESERDSAHSVWLAEKMCKSPLTASHNLKCVLTSLRREGKQKNCSSGGKTSTVYVFV